LHILCVHIETSSLWEEFLNKNWCVSLCLVSEEAEAQLELLLGGGNILLCNRRGGGFPPLFRKFFRNKSAFLRVLSRKKEILSFCMQIWLCSIQIDFLFLCFYKIYTSNSCKMNFMSQFIEYVCEWQKSIFFKYLV